MLRREFLIGAALASASSVYAKAPFASTQTAGIYRHKIGAFELTAINDGQIGLAAQFFSGVDGAMLKQTLAANGMTENFPTAINCFIVNTGSKVILIDTGAGSTKAFGNDLGKFRSNLAVAGITPAQVDMVILTHAHIDHVEGLLTPQGQARFKNAEIIINETEYKFWHDDGNLSKAPDAAKGLFKSARDSLAPYKGRIKLVKAGEVATGISLENAAGHTPGHMVVRVASGKEQALVIGDTIHNSIIHTAYPHAGFGYDLDAKAAADSRKRIFDIIAADQTLVAGAHLPFPALGKILKDGNAFKYVPSDWLKL